MTQILIFFTAYAAVYIVLNLVAVRYRNRLREIVSKGRLQASSPRVVKILDSYLLSMTSMRTAIILFLLLVQLLVLPKAALIRDDFPEESLELRRIVPLTELLDCHMASAAAANPLFGALAYVTRLAVHVRVKRLMNAAPGDDEARLVNSRFSMC